MNNELTNERHKQCEVSDRSVSCTFVVCTFRQQSTVKGSHKFSTREKNTSGQAPLCCLIGRFEQVLDHTVSHGLVDTQSGHRELMIGCVASCHVVVNLWKVNHIFSKGIPSQ